MAAAATSRATVYLHPRHWPTWALWLWMQLSARAPLGLTLAAHAGLGRLLYLLPSRARAIARLNIGLSFPDLSAAEVNQLARRHFAALGAAFAECAVAWFASDRHIEGHFEVIGLEHVHAALSAGKGAILFTGHFTGLEICGRPLKQRIERFACMYSHRSNPLMDEFQRRGRQRCAHESIPSDHVRALLGSLKRNSAVWYAPDQAPLGSSAALVPFFAEPAMMTTATSRLARISGAPVLPFSYRRIAGTSRYELRFRPPLTDFPGNDAAADTRRLAVLLEEFVCEAPEQYFWIQKKFRGRPGLRDPYDRKNLMAKENPTQQNLI